MSCAFGLVLEVASAGEDHCDVVFVARCDHRVVSSRSARLGDGDDAGFGRLVDAVSEGEEGVRGKYGPLGAISRLAMGDVDGVESTHLSCSNADHRPILGEDDCVGFDVFCDRPHKLKIFRFCGGRLTFSDCLPFIPGLGTFVPILDQHSSTDPSVRRFGVA